MSLITMNRHRAYTLRPLVRAAVVLMSAASISLAIMSALHLAGLVHGRSKPFDEIGAGTAEAVICVVLAGGALSVMRLVRHWRAIGLATTAFAILGFGYGLSVTTRGGTLPDVVYHSTVLPLLIVTFVLFARAPHTSALTSTTS
jgi:hypothetical protein